MKMTYLVAVATVATATMPAYAAQTVFTDRTAFNAAAGGALSFESFEAATASGATVNYPGVSVTESNGIDIIVHTASNPIFTSATTDGSHSIWFDDNDSSLATFVFAAPITAFGIDVATDGSGMMTVSGGAAGAFALLAGVPQFFGVISDTPFTSLVFDMSEGPLVGFDALSFGTAGAPIPEPATWALMIGGFGIAGAAVRRQRRRLAIA